tara:strand:- start:99362 stop:99607 length:246 start_codon:yes stop_codon:yes gene_type:complete
MLTKGAAKPEANIRRRVIVDFVDFIFIHFPNVDLRWYFPCLKPHDLGGIQIVTRLLFTKNHKNMKVKPSISVNAHQKDFKT